MESFYRKLIYPAAAFLLVGALFATSCGGKKNPVNSDGGGHSSHYLAVAIRNLAFVPNSPTVAAGDTVVWTNDDNIQHTVTSDTGTTLQSPPLGTGQTYQHIFPAAGSFPYHCSIHPTMTATVIVQ